MAYQTLLIGNVARTTGVFTDPENGNVPIDPTEVYGLVEKPDQTEALYHYGVDNELTRAGEGVYVLRIPLDQPGPWTIKLQSTGLGAAAHEFRFQVEKTRFQTVVP